MEKKLLIFAIYIPIGSQSEQNVRTRLKEIREMYEPKFRSMEEQTGNIIELFIFPTHDGGTKMECVYSGDVNYSNRKPNDDLINLSSDFNELLISQAIQTK